MPKVRRSTYDATHGRNIVKWEDDVSEADSGELTAGTETGKRKFSPAQIKTMIQAHAQAGASKYSENIGDGAATVFDVTHSLGTEDITVAIRYAAGTKEAVIVDWKPTDSNTIRVTFSGHTPTTDEFRVTVIA